MLRKTLSFGLVAAIAAAFVFTDSVKAAPPDQANIFVGLAGQIGIAAPYNNDQLVMKNSEDWRRGNLENWASPPYAGAWINNEWNGQVPGGSGEVWKYRIIWVGTQLSSSSYWRSGGYPIWDQFEVILSQGTADNAHFWDAHAIATGFGGSH
jgi:hypothetical protein